MNSAFRTAIPDPSLAAIGQLSGNSRLGFANRNTTRHQDIEWSNSTLALGLPEWSGKTASDHVVAANNCQAPFLCNSQMTTATIGPPKQWTPAKQPSALSNYVAFLGCEYNSVVETITDEEDGQGWTAYGFINAGAILALRSGAGATGVGLVFVATAGVMDVGAMAKANQECTGQIYH